ncbi:MAG: 2-oxo-4-hydroxy-4-carboxy-5-ureidoimidazoline decarboxylase [Oceanospirillaceae bacterium]
MINFATLHPSQLSQSQFIAAFGDIYEHSAWIAQAAFDEGITDKHNQIAALHKLMAQQLTCADKTSKLALINAHPDLAGKAAVAGELTSASTSEQAGAGISTCTQEEFEYFNRLNTRYKKKFQFTFIMAVKGSNKQQIMAAFEKRLLNDNETEFKQAVLEINKIALSRLKQM